MTQSHKALVAAATKAMTKIVYNNRMGGFGLSSAALNRYTALKGITEQAARHAEQNDEIPRDDPVLVQVVEELGTAANGQFADLAIAEVLEGTRYRIVVYDGDEAIETPDSCEIETPDSCEWLIAGTTR